LMSSRSLLTRQRTPLPVATSRMRLLCREDRVEWSLPSGMREDISEADGRVFSHLSADSNALLLRLCWVSSSVTDTVFALSTPCSRARVLSAFCPIELFSWLSACTGRPSHAGEWASGSVLIHASNA
jgi:hypothetical protein